MFIASAAGRAVGRAARGTMKAAAGAVKGAVKGVAKGVSAAAKGAASAAAGAAGAAAAGAGTASASGAAGNAGNAPTETGGSEPKHGTTGEDLANEMYPDLKRCLCDSLAKMFTDTSPALVKIVLESVEGTIATDEGIKTYIQQRIRNIAGEVIKEQQTKELIVQSLTDNCNSANAPDQHQQQGGRVRIKSFMPSLRKTRRKLKFRRTVL
jgi:hypothetical protein